MKWDVSVAYITGASRGIGEAIARRALAAEVHHAGVLVSIVNPGPVKSDFTKARGVQFQQSLPRPLDPDTIATATLDAVTQHRFEQTRPRWLAGPIAIRSPVPKLYLGGLVRDFSDQSEDLVQRIKEGR